MHRTKYQGLMYVAYRNPKSAQSTITKYAGLRLVVGLEKQAQAEQPQTPYMIPTYQHMIDKVTKNWSPGAQAAGQLVGGVSPYFIPVARTIVPAQSALANAVNIFTPGLTAKQRMAYGGSAVVDGALAALGLISDVGTGAATVATLPAAGAGGVAVGGATSAATGSIAAALRASKWFRRLQAAKNAVPGGQAATKYLKGGHKWQKAYSGWAEASRFKNPIVRGVTTLPKKTLHFFTGHPLAQLGAATSAATAVMPGEAVPTVTEHNVRNISGGMAANPRPYVAPQISPRDSYFQRRWGQQHA